MSAITKRRMKQPLEILLSRIIWHVDVILLIQIVGNNDRPRMGNSLLIRHGLSKTLH